MAMKKRNMRKRIGWTRRTAEGERIAVEVAFFAGKLHWEQQEARFETRVHYMPDPEDWDRLEEQVRNRIARGLMQAEDLKVVTDARSRAPGGDIGHTT